MVATNEQSQMLDDVLIDDERVATAYGITRQTVWKWAKAGRIPGPVVNRNRYARWSNNAIREDIERIKREAMEEAAT